MFEDQRKTHDERGRFLPNNKFWRVPGKRNGPPKIFETPEDLEKACFAYFDWVDENPLYEQKVFGNGMIVNVPKARAMTIKGMCVHMNIARRTWDHYRARDEFKETCEMVEDIIYDQKFSGAAAGFFSAVIIARDLGLTDKREVDENLTVEVVDRFVEDNDPE